MRCWMAELGSRNIWMGLNAAASLPEQGPWPSSQPPGRAVLEDRQGAWGRILQDRRGKLPAGRPATQSLAHGCFGGTAPGLALGRQQTLVSQPTRPLPKSLPSLFSTSPGGLLSTQMSPGSSSASSSARHQHQRRCSRRLPSQNPLPSFAPPPEEPPTRKPGRSSPVPHRGPKGPDHSPSHRGLNTGPAGDPAPGLSLPPLTRRHALQSSCSVISVRTYQPERGKTAVFRGCQLASACSSSAVGGLSATARACPGGRNSVHCVRPAPQAACPLRELC